MGVFVLGDGVEFFDDMWWGWFVGIVYVQVDDVFVMVMSGYFQFGGDIENVGGKVVDVCEMVCRV